MGNDAVRAAVHPDAGRQAARAAASIGAGNKEAVPVQPVLRVMVKYLRGEDKLRHATVAEVLIP